MLPFAPLPPAECLVAHLAITILDYVLHSRVRKSRNAFEKIMFKMI